VLALPGGLLGQRFGNRRVALWGLALIVGGGLVTAASHSLWAASAGRLLSGAGGVLLIAMAEYYLVKMGGVL